MSVPQPAAPAVRACCARLCACVRCLLALQQHLVDTCSRHMLEMWKDLAVLCACAARVLCCVLSAALCRSVPRQAVIGRSSEDSLPFLDLSLHSTDLLLPFLDRPAEDSLYFVDPIPAGSESLALPHTTTR